MLFLGKLAKKPEETKGEKVTQRATNISNVGVGLLYHFIL